MTTSGRPPRFALALGLLALLPLAFAPAPTGHAVTDDCTVKITAVFCDDFTRASLGPDWTHHRGNAAVDGADLVLSAPNSWAAVSYAADTTVGEGTLELIWDPTDVPTSWTQLHVAFRFDSFATEVWTNWHFVALRVDEGDICIWTSLEEPCAAFPWTAKKYKVQIHHVHGLLTVRMDGAVILSAAYPEDEPGTHILIQVADNGTGQKIDQAAFVPPFVIG